MQTKPHKTHCGYIAIIGRPNVGKSTLLNKILGQKISITARKPQTTRHKILGIKTEKNIQAIYVDTPGFHRGKKRRLNKYMMKEIKSALADIDIIIFVVDGFIWKEDEELILENIIKLKLSIILVINKVDHIKNKPELLPYIEKLTNKYNFAAIIPLSAKTGKNVSELEKTVTKLLPENPFYFLPEQITDKPERFLVAEIIREKLTRLSGQELPHELTVGIEKFEEQENIINIAAIIYVERPGQKIIIISKLKEIGTKARIDMEKLLGKKVFLQTWVKVKRGWSDDKNALQNF